MIHQAADLVVRFWQVGQIKAPVPQPMHGFLEADDRAQNAGLYDLVEQHQGHQQAEQEHRDQGPEVASGNQRIQVQQGNLKPANGGQKGHAGQMLAAIHRHKPAFHRAIFAITLFEHLQHAQNLLFVLGIVEQ